MLCVVIKGPTFQAACEQMSKALPYADLAELRLDSFEVLDDEAIKTFRSQFPIPMVFTLRSQAQGGDYQLSEEQRQSTLLRLAALRPDYLDVEGTVPLRLIQEIRSQYPEIKIILSHHNFTHTPEDLDELYATMQKIPASFYKIAVMASSSLDAMRLLCWAKKFQGENTLIPISMGSYGQISRILGKIIGNPITYACAEEEKEAAPGQLSAQTLIERYHYRSLNVHTAIYGLIGDPTDKSVSDETHNDFIERMGLNAIYVKVRVTPSELPHFLQFAKRLPFQGLSVTMPLKEAVIPLLDEIEPLACEMEAVNTLLFKGGRVCGFNTDGRGALNAIEEHCSVKGKRVVIIGTGGAAKAIAYEARRRGALITIVSREKQKALAVASAVDGLGRELGEMALCAKSEYEVLINCTPASPSIDSEYILPHALVMDITTKPKETPFLQQAEKRGCSIVYGYHMFVEQALGQFHLWFTKEIDLQKERGYLMRKTQQCIEE